MLKTTSAILCITAILASAGCTGVSERNAARSQSKASKAQEEVSKERLALVEQYQTCVEDAGGNASAVEACDVYLRSAEALK